MFDDYNICPYSGLRSFTEDESIFFKGRDEQIDQICRLLEKNKFLMVTGASGEGKSSLVYAGMIPNARAGFFKAKHTNWQVVDFRPERTPLENLAEALAGKLQQDKDSITTELSRGYSSLVDLYKNSNLYYDEGDETWNKKTTEEKTSSKRNASNLIILIDQFEEFFTNPENFNNNSPSEDSQVTVNLLLETAKIALEEDLPIYVVCTMRSDYIGQCNAFRGLPEAIGFSQFFVPRLKRNELRLIIEEPALLNGNKITSRLVERLLYDLSEGIDQLPILQHALSHIWHAANNGAEEMDLIHYALVGGMPYAELPDEDKARFITWFKSLPDYQRELYHTPGIKRVIEIHANQLYEGAYEYYKKSNPKSTISLKEVRNIIAITFACLTKIDDSRAVRNRMTLEEITGIINMPDVTVDTVNEILNIYREQDNSFIRPFIKSDNANRKLAKDDVLDITHESLIRNWGLLKKWANKEFEYYTTFLDFRKQLNRWLESNKSKNYLLPLGPLSFFENWEQECRPNKYWVYRYEGNNGVWPDTLEEAQDLLENAYEFLRKSNRKVLVTRTFMKYGANRIAAVVAVIAVIFLSAFYFIDAKQKQNKEILKGSIEKGTTLLSSKAIQANDKATFLLFKERAESGSLLSHLRSMENEDEQIMLAISSYNRLLHFDKKFDGELKNQLILHLKDLLANHDHQASETNAFLIELSKLITLLSYDYYYNSQAASINLLVELNQVFVKMVKTALSEESSINPEVLRRGLQFYLTFNNPGARELEELLDRLNPFNPSTAENFKQVFPKGSTLPDGRIVLDHNGGYHLLASLFAALGDTENVIRSLDSLALTKDYYNSIPFNGPANILGYLYQYGHTDKVALIIEQIDAHSVNSRTQIYQDLIDRSSYLKHLYSANINANISESNAGFFGPNLVFLAPEKRELLFADYEKHIQTIDNSNERHYLLAQLNKQHGIFITKYNYDRGLSLDDNIYQPYFDRFIEHYNQLDKEYLNESDRLIYRYYGGGLRQRAESKGNILIYPDHIGGFFSETYHTPVFFRYLEANGLLNEFYKDPDALQLLSYWIANYNEVYTFVNEETFKHHAPITLTDYEMLRNFMKEHPMGHQVDQNLINIILVNKYFELGLNEKAFDLHSDLNLDNYPTTAKQFEYLNEAFFFNQVNELARNLSRLGAYKDAVMQIESYARPAHKVLGYILSAEAMYLKNYDPVTFDFLDSAFTIRSAIKEQDLLLNEEYRDNLARVLALIGGQANEIITKEVVKSINEVRKPNIEEIVVLGHAFGGDFYAAQSAIGRDFTEASELNSRSAIIAAHLSMTDTKADRQKWHGMYEYIEHMLRYKYNMRGL